jgi:hypothetical protein
MARYSMHLRDGTENLLDPDALEFASVEALRTAVLLSARDLLAHDAGNGMLDSRFRIDAENEDGAIVYSIQLRHAVAELLVTAGLGERQLGKPTGMPAFHH